MSSYQHLQKKEHSPCKHDVGQLFDQNKCTNRSVGLLPKT